MAQSINQLNLPTGNFFVNSCNIFSPLAERTHTYDTCKLNCIEWVYSDLFLIQKFRITYIRTSSTSMHGFSKNLLPTGHFKAYLKKSLVFYTTFNGSEHSINNRGASQGQHMIRQQHVEMLEVNKRPFV